MVNINNPSHQEAFNVGISDIRYLNESIKTKYDVDFSNYALSSYQRRIARFMTLEKIASINELVQRLLENPEFFELYLKEITVNTTEMFRDPLLWKRLKEEVLPKLASHDRINIWHAGCSSGEEVYSMAIVLKETGLYEKAHLVASDINEKVMAQAMSGEYNRRNMLEVNTENYKRYGGALSLDKYYHVFEDKLKMNNDLLKNVSFKKHNLVSDGNFSKFDIILCRNVMIYFDNELQDKVVDTFIKSLHKDGFLIIGAMESLVLCSQANRFRTISDKEKIYQIKS